MTPQIKILVEEYKKRRAEIKKRLEDFARLHKGKDDDIFSELAFCLFTPQAKATSCAAAVKKLQDSGLLLKGSVRSIRSRLKGSVRFHNNKAKYLVGARRLFKDEAGCLDLKCKVRAEDPLGTRQWLVENVKGLGYKEASHFLRNIGLGRDLAILDVHILKNLKKYGVIREIPSSLTPKRYMDIEGRMRQFSKKTGIPLGELDLLFWSIETGFVFK